MDDGLDVRLVVIAFVPEGISIAFGADRNGQQASQLWPAPSEFDPRLADDHAIKATSNAPAKMIWVRDFMGVTEPHFPLFDLPAKSTPSSFHLARMSALAKKPACRKSSLPLASKKICVGMTSTP